MRRDAVHVQLVAGMLTLSPEGLALAVLPFTTCLHTSIMHSWHANTPTALLI